MAVRMKDIAQDLGVSVMTVSKALRDHTDIGAATRARVQRRARQLGYQPDGAARTLVTGRSHAIGLVVPDLVHPFFSQLARSLGRALRGHGCTLVCELSKAIRARGMKFITTFHHDRHCQLYQDAVDEKVFQKSHYPFIRGMPPTTDDPKLKLLYGNLPKDECYDRFWLGKLVEVIDAYRPDIIWVDSWLDKVPDDKRRQFAAYYLNRAAQWKKDVVITYKQEDLPQSVGVLDLEKGRMGDKTDFAWLTDDTISKGSWSYTTDLGIKSTTTVLHSLIDIVAKNGVLLLNISPRADGTIPDDQTAVLLGIGKWLRRNGEAIYGTRPWRQYGEGPTQLTKGRHGGFTDQGSYTAQDLRYTAKGNNIYVTALGWPGDGTEIVAKAFAAERIKERVKIEKVSLIGSRENIRWELRPDGLGLTASGPKLDDMAVVFKVETDSSTLAAAK